jgi:hypothetical protein
MYQTELLYTEVVAGCRLTDVGVVANTRGCTDFSTKQGVPAGTNNAHSPTV